MKFFMMHWKRRISKKRKNVRRQKQLLSQRMCSGSMKTVTVRWWIIQVKSMLQLRENIQTGNHVIDLGMTTKNHAKLNLIMIIKMKICMKKSGEVEREE